MTDVEQLLQDKEILFHSKGKDLLVKCLNPEHEDDNPSMRIDREGGQFHCLSCGYKGNVFTLFNRHRNIFNAKVLTLKRKLGEIRKVSWAGYPIPADATPFSKMFRGIPAETLEKYGAFTTNELGMAERLVFPILDNMGAVQGFQGRYIYSDASPKYMMYPKEVALPWYPSPKQIEMINSSIILVEGLLDALYLQSKGLTNSVCAFGTKSVKYDTVLELITPYMLAGLQTIYLMMDGDPAGRAANESIKRVIQQKTDLVVEVIELPDDTDPAELSDEYIENIKNYLTNS